MTISAPTESKETVQPEALSAQESWIARGQKALTNTYATNLIVLTHGQGSYVYDAESKQYLDFASGIAVNALGHANAELVAAITGQVQKLSHCSNLYYNMPAIELAEALTAGSSFDRAFFCNSGAEAIEAALKLSRKYAKAHKGDNCSTVLTMSNSFHGRTYGALSATAQTKYHAGYHPLVPDFQTVTFNDFDSILACNLQKVAAIVIEPVQGEGGVHVADAAFLKRVRELCTAHNIVLIFDEIQCGVGRTGTFFAHEKFAVAPDIVAMAKGLGGGFPIGAILASEKLASAFSPGDHGSTFGGNPLASAAALACVKTINDEPFLSAVNLKCQFLKQSLSDLQSKTSAIKAIRGLGLMIGVELASPAKPVVQKCAEHGLLIVAAGENVIRLLPPLTISEEEISLAVQIIESALL